MGLSSSQARLLTLTSRQHAIEYSAQKLEAQKLQLANESDKVYNEYLQRLDAVKLQYRDVGADGAISYNDATFTKLLSNKFLFNVGGVVCDSLGTPPSTAGGTDGTGVLGEIGKQYGYLITPTDSYTLLSSLVAEGLVVMMELSDDPTAGWTYDNSTKEVVYTDPATGNEEIRHSVTATGTTAHLHSTATPYDGDPQKDNVYRLFKDTSISTSTKVSEVSDEKLVKMAEAQYEADMSRINRKDSRYDTELSQFETERNAIKNEIDSLKTVANDNVERTFKIFS